MDHLTTDHSTTKGSFEFIEAKILRDADGTSFGSDFKWLCKWFLENAPRYRSKFENVWLWDDWPNRWGRIAESMLLPEHTQVNYGRSRLKWCRIFAVCEYVKVATHSQAAVLRAGAGLQFSLIWHLRRVEVGRGGHKQRQTCRATSPHEIPHITRPVSNDGFELCEYRDVVRSDSTVWRNRAGRQQQEWPDSSGIAIDRRRDHTSSAGHDRLPRPVTTMRGFLAPCLDSDATSRCGRIHGFYARGLPCLRP